MGQITDLVRGLRKNATSEEQLLWKHLRGRKLKNHKFLRQQPIIHSTIPRQFFVADFYCAESKLVVEVDGKYHDFQKDYDANRDAVLESLGLHVIRFRNEELKEIEDVLKRIEAML